MTTPSPQSPATSLYEQDYYLWLEKMAHLLRTGKLDELDLENLAEEIADMGRSERRTVESNLERVLMHLLKYQYQPEKRSSSWRYTLLEHRDRLEKSFCDSPSLKITLGLYFSSVMERLEGRRLLKLNCLLSFFPTTVRLRQNRCWIWTICRSDQAVVEKFVPDTD